MTLNELILQLQTQAELGNGDCQVRINADHGQTLMNATWVETSYIDEDTYMPELVEEAQEGAIKVVEIQGY